MTRCRRITCKSSRSAFRSAHLAAHRPCHRRALRQPFRHVLPDTRPSLHDLCVLMNRYVKSAEAYRKKWQPHWNEGRFKMLRPPEESDRIFLEHLARIYGAGSPASSYLE